MKHRIPNLFLLVGLLLFLSVTNLASFISPLLGSGQAFAVYGSAMTDAQYTLFYPDDDTTVSQLVAAAKDGGIGPSDVNGPLSKTVIYTKDGPLDATALHISHFSDDHDLPMYSIDYYCSPNDVYKISLDKPSDSVPYIRYTLGVSVLRSGDWKGLTTDSSYETHEGLLGNSSVGTVHWPSISDTTSGYKPAKDYDLPGYGGDNDLRTGVKVDGSTTHAKNASVYSKEDGRGDYSFDKYPGGDSVQNKPGFDGLQYVFDQCNIPMQTTLSKVTNYQKLPPDQQAIWDTAMQNAGLGSSVADAAATANLNSDGPETPALSCHIGFNLAALNPLNWLLCGAIKGMVGIIGVLDDAITSQLSVGTKGDSDKPSQIFCDKGVCDAYHEAWKSFRNIALGLMVIAGLVVVIAQALGTELLDAYTLRKVLPRILIAAVGITLSWQLMEFFVTLTNDLGYGVRHLIYAPFGHLGGDSLNLGSAAFNGVSLVTALGAIAFGAFGILSFAATGALALFIAFMVLVIRQIAIIMLLILAPVAIVSYVLPNTQRVYKFWWESFSKALLMFPLIAAFIAAGRVFSLIAAQNQGNVLNQLVAFVAYFAPYFLIPLTFKFAGGFVRQLGGFVNDRGRGGFDSLRNFRAQRAKQRRELFGQKFKTGDFKNPIPGRFKRLNRATGAVVSTANTVGRHSSSGLIRGGLGFGARGRTAQEALLMQGIENAGKERPMADNAGINAFNRLMVLTAKHHGNQVAAEEELRQWYASDRNEYNRAFEGRDLEEKLADAKARMANVGGFNAGRAGAAYLAMGRDGTAIRDVEDMGQIAAWVSEGSENTAYGLISQVGSDSKRVGRSELAPSQDHKAALASASVRQHAGQVVPNYDEVIDRATMSGAGGETGLSVLSGAPSRVVRGNVEHGMNIIKRYMDDPTSVNFEDAAQAASVVLDLKNNAEMGYGKADNKIAFQTAMSQGDRATLLERFLEEPAPARSVPATGPPTEGGGGALPTASQAESTRAHVNRLVGDRYSTMAPDQLARMSDEQRRAVEEQQRRQQEGQ